MQPQQPPSPYARPLPRAWRWGIALGLAGALALAGLARLGEVRLEGRGGVLEKLTFITRPYLTLIEQQVGRNAQTGAVEYLVWLRQGQAAGEREAFLGRHPGMDYVREGDLADTVVVSATAPVSAALDDLRNDPGVSMVLRNRGFFFCH